MPRYYFHVSNETYGRDQDGTDLPDLMAARCEAVEFAGRLIAEDPEGVSTSKAWSMEVTDHNALLLFRLDFAVTASPTADRAIKAATSDTA